MKSFTLELIMPTQKYRRYPRGLRIPELTLPVLAALTPPGIEVIITEEEIEEVTFKSGVDLVGLSFMTPMAPRAYEIADEYRSRRVKVVMGGIHASALPEEAARHADAVVIGEAENIWNTLLEDFASNRLRKYYRSADFADLSRMPHPRRELLKKSMTFSPYPIQTARGCPFACDFCSVTKFFGKTFRYRPVKEVVREIESTEKKNWVFVDDNIIGNQKYAKNLFRELIPLNIRWAGQSSVLIGRNDELLRLAAESGCTGLLIGFESISYQNLQSVHKSFSKVEYYEDCIKKLHDHGILVQASFIFGLDYDDKAVFEETVDFLRKSKVAAVSFSVLTPFPGTQLFEKLSREGRILDYDWSKYDFSSVVYRPKRMTPEELWEGIRKARKEIYSYKSILSRFTANRFHPLLYSVVNLSYHARNRKMARCKDNMNRILSSKCNIMDDKKRRRR